MSVMVVTGGSRGIGYAVCERLAGELRDRCPRIDVLVHNAGVAERWRAAGITVDAVPPGVVRTGLGDRRGPLGLLLKAAKRTWAAPEEGARHVVSLAGAPGTGRYFDQDRQVPLQGPALDAGLARRVWDEAEALAAAR
ncbi:hypothetical protein ACIA8R_26765 [Nonomuraea sp. NPDC051191]|uniref:hypothetical protein n=1 Tax=Nonomuraea sp. NPDC051191 TaxID=3364372 RepID=UPI00379C90A1